MAPFGSLPKLVTVVKRSTAAFMTRPKEREFHVSVCIIGWNLVYSSYLLAWINRFNFWLQWSEERNQFISWHFAV